MVVSTHQMSVRIVLGLQKIKKMKATYINNFYNISLVDSLINEVPWVNESTRRRECFMSNMELEYNYLEHAGSSVYKSNSFHPVVKEIMNKINTDYGYDLDICFLNLYMDQAKALGWHADDSHSIDHNQPIAVVSFGAEREIWTKPKGVIGTIPNDWKTKLANGSLFIMPAGFQNEYLHRIPKCDRECGPRVSLTFRKYKK